jgi:hypothetical protein
MARASSRRADLQEVISSSAWAKGRDSSRLSGNPFQKKGKYGRNSAFQAEIDLFRSSFTAGFGEKSMICANFTQELRHFDWRADA